MCFCKENLRVLEVWCGGVFCLFFIFKFPEELSKSEICWINSSEYEGSFVNCLSGNRASQVAVLSL